jgi:hypothetical protein
MLHHKIHWLAGVILLICACILPSAPVMSESEVTVHEGRMTPNSIISKRLAFYNDIFPQVQFVHAEGGDTWHEDYGTILALLGKEATSLDYEHPENLRQDLLDANLYRIKLMLMNDLASATLFRVGSDSALDREHVCIISLNPDAVAENDAEATRYIANLPDELASKIHPTRFLNREQHVRFAVVHEVFHCLDSLYNGGAPMTTLPLGAEYNQFLREGAADAFAAAIHLRTHGETTDYLRNLMHLRAIWLFSDGPNRCTFEFIRATVDTDLAKLRAMTLKDLISFSTDIGNEVGGSYDYFVQQRAAALEAAKAIGFKIQIYNDAWRNLEEISPETEGVEYRIKWYKYFLATLFNDQDVAFDMPRAPE